VIRLIVEFTTGDGCTFSCENTRPVVYESAEGFSVAFEEWCKANRNTYSGLYGLEFAGHSWDPTDFFYQDSAGNDVYSGPEIYTVDEYFAEVENK
jgi:hypothetical protein